MKLRKLYIAIGVTAASVSLLSSCAMDDIIQQYNGTEIAFRPTLGTTPSSRAAETTVASFKNREIVVTAVDQHGDYYFKDVTFHPLDPESTSPVYVSDQKYYWPGDGSPLHFTAYPKDYVTRGLLNPATNTLTYQPRSSWYADENKTFDGGTFIPNGTLVTSDRYIYLPAGEIVEPDGTVRLADGTKIFPDYSIHFANGTKVDTNRNITFSDGITIDQAGETRLSNGAFVYPNGTVKLLDGTIISRETATTYPDGTIVYSDQSIKLWDGTILPAPNIDPPKPGTSATPTYWYQLPNKAKINNEALVELENGSTITSSGDFNSQDAMLMRDFNEIWLGSSIIDIYINDHITFYKENSDVPVYTIYPDGSIAGLPEPSPLPPHEDLVLSHVTGNKENISGLPLLFAHKLSQIEVHAKCDNPNYTYEIVNVKLANVLGEGSLPLKKDANWTSTPDLKQTYKADFDYQVRYFKKKDNKREPMPIILEPNIVRTITDPHPFYTEEVVGPTTGQLYGSLMVVPQTFTPWDPTAGSTSGAYIGVKLRITTKLGGEVYPVAGSDDKYAWVAVPLSGTWDAGKRYVYTLDFTNGAGYSDPEQANPHLVLNGLFKFTLNVTDWQEGVGDSYPIDPK